MMPVAKPSGLVFDASWRGRCFVRHAAKGEVTPLVLRHYLRRHPGVEVCRLLMEHDEQGPIGMVIFALPPRETIKRYGGEAWELARLWIADEVPFNAESWLIGQAIRHIKAEHQAVQVLVSYADPSVGHHGGIYRASNWETDGRTDQERKTPRVDYYYGEKKFSRRSHAPPGVELTRIPRVSKYRYIYRLRRER